MEEELQTQTAENVQEAQPASEQPSPAVEPQVADQVVDEQPQSTQSGGRAQRRISDLSGQLKESEAERERLRAEMEAMFSQADNPQDPWEAASRGDITIDELRSAVNKTAEFTAQKETEKLRREIARKEMEQELQSEVRKIEAEYSHFNPASEDYDDELTQELGSLYREAYLGKKNAPKLSAFVSKFEKLRAKAEAQGIERSSAQLAEQAAQSAVVTGPVKGGGSPTRQSLIDQGKQTGDFKDLFKSMLQ